MKTLFYIFLIAFIVCNSCINQEVSPNLNINSKGCLIKELVNYNAAGSHWRTSTQQFEYDGLGNPVKVTLLDEKRKITNIYTYHYSEGKLTRIDSFHGDTDSEENLKFYKTFEVAHDYLTIIIKNYRKENVEQFVPYEAYEYTFFRNKYSELKLTRLERIGLLSSLKDIKREFNQYSRYEYDNENVNVAKFIHGNGSHESVGYNLAGFDRNGKSPWNTNFWLSLTRDIGNSFDLLNGFWSENNLALLTPGDNGSTIYYYTYDLNSEGYPCISTQKLANNQVDPSETFWYYYNCECKGR